MNARLFSEAAPSYASHSFPEPREFQNAAHERLRQGVRDGHKRQLLMAPTGAGKTFVMLRIAHEALVRGKKVLFVADRRNLIDQTSATADRYGLSAHGIVMADHWRYAPDMPFQIASAQTLMRREWPPADVILIDEAHTQYSTWTEYIQSDKCKAIVVGASATPFSPGLGRIFTNLVGAATMAELTESGVLVPMRVLSCKQIDMTGAATSGGEWTDGAAGERGMQIIGDVVTEWIKHGEGRKTIFFGATIAHCNEVCKQFNEAGIMAAVFCQDTPPAEREACLKEFSKPDSAIKVLLSVEALAKGMDQRDVGCVIDCRPLRKSLSTAIQMWGRGLRASPETGKTDCILLDHSGNITRFADDFADVFHHGLHSLDAGEKLDKAIRKEPESKEPKACPACGFKPMGKKCISCGHEVVKAAVIEAIPGHMQPVVIGKSRLADNHRHLYEQVVTYVRSHGRPETAKGRAAHLFRQMTGEWPNAFSYERTHNTTISRAVMNQIKARQIAFAKGRAAGGSAS